MSIRTVARGPSRLLAAAVSAVTIAATVAVTGLSGTAAAADPLLSQGKPATASSTENAGTPAVGRRRRQHRHPLVAARSADPQWLQVDLGATATITQVVLNWEAAYAQGVPDPDSADGTDLDRRSTRTTTGTGGIQTLTVTGTGRYVRMYGTARGHRLRLLAVGVPGLRHDRRRAPAAAAPPTPRWTSPATASSTENAGTPASAAVDGNTGTRWSSAFSDPQWLQVDLGATADDLPGRAATGRPRTPRRSRSRPPTDGTDLDRHLLHHHRHRRHPDPRRHRHRPLRADVRHRPRPPGTATRCGSSAVLTGTAGHAPATPTAPIAGRRRPRPERASSSTRRCPARRSRPARHGLHASRRPTSSAPQRYALLFKPGTYNGLNAQIGFYTSVAGLGLNPDDVHDQRRRDRRRRLVRRQRHPELLALGGEPVRSTRSAGTDRWAVAQAAPFRRMHVHGGLNLAPERLRLGQRRLHRRQPRSTARSARTRSSSGTPATARSAAGPTASGTWCSPASRAPRRRASRTRRTPRSRTTPVIREKPYLYVDAAGNYQVFVPALRTNAPGTTWAERHHAGHVAAARASSTSPSRATPRRPSTRRWPRA